MGEERDGGHGVSGDSEDLQTQKTTVQLQVPSRLCLNSIVVRTRTHTHTYFFI